MSTENNDPTQAILEKVRGEIKKWQAVESALLSGQMIQAQVKPDRQRAPDGTLHNAIKQLLSRTGQKLGVSQIGTALQESGYQYSTKAKLVAKAVQELYSEKQIQRVGEGRGTKYHSK